MNFPSALNIGRYVDRDGTVILYAEGEGFPKSPSDQVERYVSITYVTDLIEKVQSLRDVAEKATLEKIFLITKMKDLNAANADDMRNALEAIADLVKPETKVTA